MLRFTYLYRNLTRNLMRSLLTCAAVALPISIYVLSMSVVDGIDQFLENSAKQLRLVTSSKASIINPLPVGHRRKIETLDPSKTRLLSVCGIRYIGGKIENDPIPLGTMAADTDTFLATFPEYALTPEQTRAWYRDRQAIIVGVGTAATQGWKIGDRVSFKMSFPPYTEMEFNIVATSVNTKDPNSNFCRADYLQEVVKDSGVPSDIVSFFFIKCASAADLDYFRTAIDELFANSPDETKTQDEKTFMNEFITQQFDLPRNLTILSLVTVFVAIMAAANTMSMNFRDRANEYAIIKSLGFGSWTILGLVQSESLLLCVMGGIIGAAAPFIAFTYTPIGDYPVPLILHLIIRPGVCAEALVISAAIGVLAALWPTWHASRSAVATALRAIE